MSAAPADSALLDEWPAELVRRRWTFHRVPDRESPGAIAAVFRWRGLGLADVVVLLHAGRARGYRVVLTAPGHPAMSGVPSVATDAERRLAAGFIGRRCVIRPPRG
ncbi:hypothetical protein [Saccharothrix yanglingensis]|uniref:Uncharacterized protein n=1 Tax=Saccharothrix yanglingensis TaxID=659496 RepID=A0ABU0X2P6_9PSEU|nr:hypothetical protein [Saccharothrix yanglingensis]MDQ2585887.1 hypothetical protein [Saccharothrix yanglingensis]